MLSTDSVITNLRMDPYERGFKEGAGAMEFVARNMWLLVPVQEKIKEFFADFDQYPYQNGPTLNAAGIGYGMLQKESAMERLKKLETMKTR